MAKCLRDLSEIYQRSMPILAPSDAKCRCFHHHRGGMCLCSPPIPAEKLSAAQFIPPLPPLHPSCPWLLATATCFKARTRALCLKLWRWNGPVIWPASLMEREYHEFEHNMNFIWISNEFHMNTWIPWKTGSRTACCNVSWPGRKTRLGNLCNHALG